MLKIRYLPRFAVIRAEQCRPAPGGYAPAEWRLASTEPARAARPAPDGYASRVVNGGKGKNDGSPQTTGVDG